MDKAASRRDPNRGAPRCSCPGVWRCLLWDVRRRVPLFSGIVSRPAKNSHLRLNETRTFSHAQKTHHCACKCRRRAAASGAFSRNPHRASHFRVGGKFQGENPRAQLWPRVRPHDKHQKQGAWRTVANTRNAGRAVHIEQQERRPRRGIPARNTRLYRSRATRAHWQARRVRSLVENHDISPAANRGMPATVASCRACFRLEQKRLPCPRDFRAPFPFARRDAARQPSAHAAATRHLPRAFTRFQPQGSRGQSWNLAQRAARPTHPHEKAPWRQNHPADSPERSRGKHR